MHCMHSWKIDSQFSVIQNSLHRGYQMHERIKYTPDNTTRRLIE
jgi:hypothetical protein